MLVALVKNDMQQETYKKSVLLFIAATIWGFAFVAQQVGMDYIGPLTFNGVRFLIGGIVLLPLIRFRSYYRGKIDSVYACRSKEEKRNRALMTGKAGLLCGCALFCGSLFQQLGIQRTTVGKAGFITALYIIIVPILGIFLRKKVRKIVWVSAVLASAGFYLLCINESFSVNQGDLLVFICAILFSFHILLIDHFAPKTDGVQLSCIQFFVSGVICMAGAFIFEQPNLENIWKAAIPLLYTGVLSCGVGYTLQIVGQKGMNPTIASLIMSLESVVAVLAGWLILRQTLSVKELLGCAVVFLAVILVQLPIGVPKEQS